MDTMYDEEFQQNLKLAKNLLDKIKSYEDKVISARWISKLCNLKSNDILVKKYRNAFFRYMLRVIQEEARHVDECAEESTDSESQEDLHYKATCHWSPDKRSYTAMKPLGHHGALIYIATAKDLALGWDVPQKQH
ncbi:uncharacterized protein LOC134533059 [Bacillus rossius redtenbacheri]|uniref:uncharacterized protein LOC134533059 n=1 Tax=Bacillus rossius redtenbacheri TaxID=93214 RepID=UPI002FDCD67E